MAGTIAQAYSQDFMDAACAAARHSKLLDAGRQRPPMTGSARHTVDEQRCGLPFTTLHACGLLGLAAPCPFLPTPAACCRTQAQQIGRRRLRLSHVTAALQQASGDSRVRGLVGVLGPHDRFEGELAQVQELRSAVLDFRCGACSPVCFSARVPGGCLPQLCHHVHATVAVTASWCARLLLLSGGPTRHAACQDSHWRGALCTSNESPAGMQLSCGHSMLDHVSACSTAGRCKKGHGFDGVHSGL